MLSILLDNYAGFVVCEERNYLVDGLLLHNGCSKVQQRNVNWQQVMRHKRKKLASLSGLQKTLKWVGWLKQKWNWNNWNHSVFKMKKGNFQKSRLHPEIVNSEYSNMLGCVTYRYVRVLISILDRSCFCENPCWRTLIKIENIPFLQLENIFW